MGPGQGALTGQATAPEDHVVQGHSAPVGGISSGREGHLKRVGSLGHKSGLRPSLLPPAPRPPQLTRKSSWIRPVATTSSCQPGPQGPEFCHRVKVSALWVSSSRSSATSGTGGGGSRGSSGPSASPSLLAVPCPRTLVPPMGCPPRLCSSPPSFPGHSPQDTPPQQWGPGHPPPEAAWYQSLSSQVGSALCRTGERRAAVEASFPRWVPTAMYQPGPAERLARGAGSKGEGAPWRPAQASPRSVPRVWSARGPRASSVAPARSRSQL